VKLSVRLFAVARELAGCERLDLELPEGSTVGQLRSRLAEAHPALAAVLPHVLFAVGSEYAGDDAVVAAGSEVACIPPVSGG
jgi:sulfur-carrier protein